MICLTLVRFSRDQSIVAHYEPHIDGVTLIRVTPDAGPVPNVDHIIGGVFPDLAAMRRAILAAMREPVGDTLDRVLLTWSAYDKWLSLCRKFVRSNPDIDPASIQDKRARPISDGQLLIWVDLPNKQTIQLILPPTDWAWRVK